LTDFPYENALRVLFAAILMSGMPLDSLNLISDEIGGTLLIKLLENPAWADSDSIQGLIRKITRLMSEKALNAQNSEGEIAASKALKIITEKKANRNHPLEGFSGIKSIWEEIMQKTMIEAMARANLRENAVTLLTPLAWCGLFRAANLRTLQQMQVYHGALISSLTKSLSAYQYDSLIEIALFPLPESDPKYLELVHAVCLRYKNDPADKYDRPENGS
jgi:hypothetical protein